MAPDETGGRTAAAAATATPDETALAWRALRHDAALVDRSERLRMRITGPQAANTLNGLITNEVTALTPGSGQYALALTPKGKIIADVRVFAVTDGLLLDVPPRAATGWSDMIRKYVNPRFAKAVDVSATLGNLGCSGPKALAILRKALGAGDAIPDGMTLYATTDLTVDGETITVAHAPDDGVDGYDIFGEPGLLARLRDRLMASGAVPATADALRVSRIEAGRPEWGVDMDDTTLAQEADMDRLGAISYTKGCYTGQETVARVHFRGHVNRQLRGLRVMDGPLPATGAELVTDEGKVVGTVGSVARSPRGGGVALALVRREVDPGTTLRAGEVGVTVVELPFPDAS